MDAIMNECVHLQNEGKPSEANSRTSSSVHLALVVYCSL